MMEASALRFQLRQADGTQRELSVDADVARVGSGAHCEIRLPEVDAAVEQLRIQAQPTGPLVEVRATRPPVLLNGATFQGGPLLPDAVLRLGSVELRVSTIDRQVIVGLRPGPTPASRRAMYVLVGLGIPLGIALLALSPPPVSSGWSLPPQRLWDKEVPGSCGETNPASAAALADKHWQEAEAAQERAPFSPQDGVQAVALFSQAAACYQTASEKEQAARASLRRGKLKQDLEQQFHVHQVRLERALVTQRYESVKTEIRILLSFVHHSGGEYANWLSTLDRQIVFKSQDGAK
ncbi:MAG TPA: FHA domain-containing protein [Polyangiaceae bacterium]|nr:FHA domain-containing protein [Polyangiaceae bacterium]